MKRFAFAVIGLCALLIGPATQAGFDDRLISGRRILVKDNVDISKRSQSFEGLVAFTTAPAAGVVLTADFEFDLPARFDTDRMELALETYGLASWGQIPVVELRT